MTGDFNYTYTTMCIVYNLVIMEAIDGLSRDNSVIILQVQDHKLKAVTWNNIWKSVELPGLCQNIHAFS